MSHGVRFEGHALDQLHHFPSDAFDALLQRIDAPWDAGLAAPGDDAALREATFGEGNGLLSFHADDDAELIRIYAITWIG